MKLKTRKRSTVSANQELARLAREHAADMQMIMHRLFISERRSLRSIARYLTDRKWPTSGMPRKGINQRWHDTTVKRVLLRNGLWSLRTLPARRRPLEADLSPALQTA